MRSQGSSLALDPSLMSELNSVSNRSDSETIWAQATQWISRTLAVAALMIAPGIAGATLDKRFGTNFLALIGFAFGRLLGTTGLIVLAKRFTPPAGGEPLAWDDDSQDNEDQDQAK